MPGPIVKQSNEGGPVLVRALSRQNGIQGYDSALVFRGTHAECAALMAQETAAGLVEVIEWEQEGAVSTITLASGNAQDGSAEKAFDTWELVGNTSQEDMSKANIFLTLTPDQVASVDVAIAEKQSGGTPDFDNWPVPGSTRDKMLDLYNLKLSHHTGFYDAQYVLRKSRWLSQRGQLKADLTNSLRVYTTAQLQAAEPIPAGIRFSIAAVEAAFPTALFSQELTGLFFRGWLKFPVTVTQVGRANKVQVTGEYWFGYWALPAYAEL